MGLIRNCRALLFTGAIGLASLLTLFEASTPGLSGWALALVPYWLALAIAWSWMLGRAPGRRGWALWMFVPLVLVLGTVLLVKIDAPLHARFALSGPSLERYARSVRSDYAADRWWGLYWVDEVEKIPGGARFMVTSLTMDWKSYGFAYIPDRAPDPEEGRYEHFKGPWYIWSDGP
ncbi:hypothetical protein BKM31_17590 [[Actinomadura] parvosata subsp. kistnae]|uniref:Uncharacterized protein n=1 Tax=[Actinomadura] parvosata subsp. kistnae TaxID=1909395 RepID=A0A1U9ZYK1_9ACTN|nr:hypothetical protein [Nonomuraea sp. ATCC 55076]AQZ63033.1 hypothetical protein BKM31_17590 [Nonomuraea sp. ATCC 55076]